MTSGIALDNFDEADVLHLYANTDMTQFEEMAGTCSNKDNVDEACFTVRSIVIGIVFVISISVLHQWSNFTYSTAYIGPALSILLIFPFGHLWTLVVPHAKPFTQKEHGLVLIMTNISWMYFSVFHYALSAALPLLEYDKLNFANYFFIVLALQFLGLGLA
ncbi:unnamed protein product, partial [Rotaria sp. Silwood2]